MFTKAQFEKNEDNNYHTENGIEMAKHFGTEDEQKLMLQIQKDHYARGHINPDEIEARNGIVKKYWHMLESETTNEVADHGSTEYYRELDKGQLNHTRSMLMKSAGQLKVAIDQRHKFSKELMGSGDRAGTGELYKMLDTLNELIEKWDDKTELYGT
jgi:hypothetical protein